MSAPNFASWRHEDSYVREPCLVPRRRRLDAVLVFPHEILVSRAALGLSSRMVVAGHQLEIILPTHGNDARFNAPEGRPIAPQHPVRGSLTEAVLRRFDDDWGYATAPNSFVVRAVRASFLVADERPEVSSIAHAVPAWFRLVEAWLLAWTAGISRRDLASATDATLIVPSGAGSYGEGARVSMTVIGGAPVAEPGQVTGALTRAGRDESLPLEWEMLVAAQQHLSRGDRRRAVIDAGTASEVALSACIRERLKRGRVSAAFQDLAIKGAGGLAGLVDLYLAEVGTISVSKNRIVDRLANRRNLAAHAGVSATAPEAVEALRLARQVVSDVKPLPNP